MPLRKLLLRIMLWSLAVAAVGGAIGILTSGATVLWRVSGTTILTAVAAAVLMGASVLVDRPHGRVAGLFAMGATLVAALLSLLMIWDLADLLPSNRPQESVGLTVFFLVLTAIPATFFLHWDHEPSARIACRVGLVMTGAIFVVLMIASWRFMGLFSRSSAHWFETAGVMTWLGVPLVACLFGMAWPRDKSSRSVVFMLRWVGASASAFGLVMALYGIWMEIHERSDLFVLIVTVAGVIAHANLCGLAPLKPSQEWIRMGTIVAAILAAVGIDWWLIIDKGISPDEEVVRITGAAAFVASCGSLALIIFSRINRKGYVEPRIYRAATEITLICPGCEKKHTLPVGESHCPTCRLKFEIRVQEPRCPQCDYMLFMLTSDRCPECGTSIVGEPGVAAAKVAPGAV